MNTAEYRNKVEFLRWTRLDIGGAVGDKERAGGIKHGGMFPGHQKLTPGVSMSNFAVGDAVRVESVGLFNQSASPVYPGRVAEVDAPTGTLLVLFDLREPVEWLRGETWWVSFNQASRVLEPRPFKCSP